MLNFSNDLFFFKFSFLFFVLIIFGYWGMDLNSEEVYIAFSFFLLVVLGFLLFSKSLAFFFIKIVNKRFSSMMNLILVVLAYRNILAQLYSKIYNVFLRSYNIMLRMSILSDSFSVIFSSKFANSYQLNFLGSLRLIFIFSLFLNEKISLKKFLSFKNQSLRIFKNISEF